MEIIKKGIKNSGRGWVGKEIKCGECRGVFRLQPEDKAEIVDESEYYHYSIRCPTSGCGNYIVWKP